MRNIFAFITIILFSPCLAFAQEDGSATLDFGAESYVFPLNASQSDWSGSEAYGSVSIFTRPTDEETWALFKQLTLGFTIMNGQVDATEISLYRMVDGEMQNLFGNADTGAELKVDQSDVEGEFLTISGEFVSDLGTSKNYGGTIDISEPVAVSGTFNVVLGPVE